MVQTVASVVISPGQQRRLLEKPRVLCRVFFSIRVLVDIATWCESRISFDDPEFHSFYTLAGPYKLFEVKGKDIFQGDVWVRNVSTSDVTYTITEILSEQY